MILSIYTFLFVDKDKFFIYNSLSNSLLEVNKVSYERLEEAKSTKCDIREEEYDEDLYKILIDKHFITENNNDEFNCYKAQTLTNRNSNGCLNVTIAPTMDCNYECHYCFEDLQKVYISDKIISSIVKYIENQKHISNVRILWFGGEPLMAIKQMKKLFDQLKSINGKTFSSGIITNGYYLTPENLKILEEMNLDSIQITLDGMKETHNKVKYAKDCKDTFSKTIKNIDLVANQTPKIHLNIRVNVNKENADEFVPLYRFLKDRYHKNENIAIAPGIIQDFEDNTLSPCSDTLFSREEVMKFGVEVYEKSKIVMPIVKYPANFFRECSIRNRNTIAFDPEGYMYKCWEIIGKKKYAVGRLDENGNITNVDHKLLNRYLYGADPLEDRKCQMCSYLPICNGGCPHHRIENVFNRKKMDTCVHYKGFLPELMRIHLETKGG